MNQCIRKHIISPSLLVSKDRPLVLVSWECLLEMYTLDVGAMKDFIRNHAHKGPEGFFQPAGEYDHLLVKEAEIPDPCNGCKYFYDIELCPEEREVGRQFDFPRMPLRPYLPWRRM